MFFTLSARIYYTVLVLIIRISLLTYILWNALFNYLQRVIIPYLALPARRALRYGTTSQVFPALAVSLQEVLNFQTYLSKILLLRFLYVLPMFTLLLCFNLLMSFLFAFSFIYYLSFSLFYLVSLLCLCSMLVSACFIPFNYTLLFLYYLVLNLFYFLYTLSHICIYKYIYIYG